MNRAADLLLQVRCRAIEKLRLTAFLMFAAGGAAMLLARALGWAGLLAGLLFLGTITLRVMVLQQRIVTTAVADTSLVYSVTGRVIEFAVPAWRVIGRE